MLRSGFDDWSGDVPETGSPGPLVLGSLLGSGRHGRVYRARSLAESPPRAVAVKVSSSPSVAAHEADALERFRHPNIVASKDRISGAIVLELARRGSLQDQIDARGPLAADEVSGVVHAVLDALECIHAQDWIHGDVNPTNIGVRSDGSIALFDFATARPADSGPIPEATPAYSGPHPRAEPVSDLRALAATARSCLGPGADLRRARLDACIRRIDRGERIGGPELREVFADVRPVPIRPGRAGGGPGRGSTVTFGPRPAPVGRPSAPPRRAGRAIAAALIALGLVTAGAVVSGQRPAKPPLETVAGPADGLTITAEASLEVHAVDWDPTSATVVAPETSGSLWRVGRSGDQAAVGDWDCDGQPTLGIYRRSTSEWFAFTSWRPGAESTPPVALDSGARLLVRRSPTGCDVPVLVD